MTTTELIMSIVSGLSMVITAILAWVSIYRTNRVAVTFDGVPVDKKDFDKNIAEMTANATQVKADLLQHARDVAASREADSIIAKQDRGDLYKKIDDVRRDLGGEIAEIDRKVAGLNATSELTNQRLVLMDSKIDRLVERKHQ